MKRQIILMDRPRMQRMIKRMAIQIWERLGNSKDVIIIGLNARGFAAAKELALHLNDLLKVEVKAHQFNVNETSAGNDIPDCNQKFVFLVDDVIFSGKTMFSALSDICNISEPSGIEIVALLDRGHRKYPLRTDLTGISVPTKLGEHIEVMLKKGTVDQAVLFKN